MDLKREALPASFDQPDKTIQADEVASDGAESILSAEPRSHSISRQAMVLITGRGLAAAFTFFIPVVLARYLNPSDYGTFKQIFLIYSSLFMALPFGIIQSLYYFIPKEPQRIRTYLVQSFLFLQGSGLAAILFLLFFRRSIAAYLNNPDLERYLLQLGIFIFLMLSSAYFEALLISSQKINQASLLGFVSEASKTACMLIPLLVFHQLSYLMWGMNLFAFFRFAFVLIYIVREYHLSWRDFEWGSFRQQLLYSFPFGLAVILQVTQDKLHHYVVSYQYSAAVFAIYSVGMFQLPIVELIYTPMSQLLIVRLTALRQKATRREVISLWYDITKKMAMVFFPMFILLQLIGRELMVFLFTETYLPSVPIFRIAIFTLVTAALLPEAALRAYADTRFILKVTFIKLAMTLLLIFPFLRWFGLQGGVLTLVIVLALAKGVLLWKMSQLVPISLPQLLPWRDLLNIGVFSTLCSVPVLFVQEIHFSSHFVSLAVSGTVYLLFYLVFLFTSHLITFDEKREIVRMFRQVGERIPAMSKF